MKKKKDVKKKKMSMESYEKSPKDKMMDKMMDKKSMKKKSCN